MVMGRHTQPAYNLQSAVDAEHALIIAHDVVLYAADNRSLEPMANAAKALLGKETSTSLQTLATPMENRLPSAKLMASCPAFLLRAPGTRTAMEHSSSATPSSINLKPTHTFVRARRR